MKYEECTPVVIVGAGPAGLAMAACLKRLSIPFVMLEQHQDIGASWRDHYDRLHLHTEKSRSSLPFLSMPRSYPRYPSRRQFIEYLDAYADRFALRPRFEQKVVSALREGNIWTIETQHHRYRASALVVASGAHREPKHPIWPNQAAFGGQIMHSAKYKNGAALKGRRVLVVGLGNSGGEIAIDLWEHGARPTLSVRSAVNLIPREILGIPFLTDGILQRHLPSRMADMLNAPLIRIWNGNLSQYGLRKPLHGPITQINEQGKVPFIDVGTIKLIRTGKVQVRPGIDRFTFDGVVFTDGRREYFDAVVLATGFLPRVDRWLQTIEPLLNEDGCPLFSGQPLGPYGLYFCGYRISPKGMLREIALESQHLAPFIATHVLNVTPSCYPTRKAA